MLDGNAKRLSFCVCGSRVHKDYRIAVTAFDTARVLDCPFDSRCNARQFYRNFGMLFFHVRDRLLVEANFRESRQFIR